MNKKPYKRVLVVDDEDVIRELLIQIFEMMNMGESRVFLVEDAPNGKEAWKKISGKESIHYDLFVTDITMPEMDGLTLKAKIEEQFPETEVIVISGNSYPPKDCPHFFQKPFSFPKFIKTVNLLTS